MKHFIVTLTAVLLFINTKAQSTEDSVKKVVNQLFEAMRNADGNALKKTFSDSAMLQTIARNKNGETVVRTESIAEFSDIVSREEKNVLDERITFDLVKIDGPLAIVWTPYQFYYKGQFSHCGVNSFQLIRFKDGWKIQYIIDTRRKQGCL